MATGIILAVVGLAVGSFLNVCIDRIPERRSVVKPRSRCDACGTPLARRDLVPLVSYMLLRGHCRYCREAISPRVPLVEAATALALVGCWWRMGQSWQMGVAAVLICAAIVAGVVAIERGLLSNRVRSTNRW